MRAGVGEGGNDCLRALVPFVGGFLSEVPGSL